MNSVWKYPIPVDDRFFIQMPRGATALTVQVQREEPQLWARVDPTAPIEERRFALCGTGHLRADINGRYVGSFQLHEGALVFHLFEVD